MRKKNPKNAIQRIEGFSVKRKENRQISRIEFHVIFFLLKIRKFLDPAYDRTNSQITKHYNNLSPILRIIIFIAHFYSFYCLYTGKRFIAFIHRFVTQRNLIWHTSLVFRKLKKFPCFALV